MQWNKLPRHLTTPPPVVLVAVLLLLLAGGWWLQRPKSSSQVSVRVPCDVRQVCTAPISHRSVQIRFDPPPRKLQPFDLTVHSAHPPRFVSFAMQSMDMGFNRFVLQPVAGEVWRGRMALPACVAGRSDWLVQIQFDDGMVEFAFQAE